MCVRAEDNMNRARKLLHTPLIILIRIDDICYKRRSNVSQQRKTPSIWMQKAAVAPS